MLGWLEDSDQRGTLREGAQGRQRHQGHAEEKALTRKGPGPARQSIRAPRPMARCSTRKFDYRRSELFERRGELMHQWADYLGEPDGCPRH